MQSKVFGFVLTVLMIINIHSQTLKFPIVSTGHIKFYDDKGEISKPSPGDPFYGQDAHYQKNVSSYTDNDDGTVTDNITGLMWQANMGDKISFDEAKTKAENLTLGGHDDWRMPTMKELYSLALFTGVFGGMNSVGYYLDTSVFDQPLGDPRAIDAQTLSSTEYVSTTMNGNATVFGFNFLDGRIKGYPKRKTWHFRMVRGNTDYGKNDFVDNGDGTITDRATGLMWQQADDGTARDWEESLEYAEGLKLAGHDNWRLPNIKELQSIVDYTRSPATTNSPAIDPLFNCTEIEDAGGNPGQYPFYWSATTFLGRGSDATYIAFGKAMGKMNGQLMDVHGAGAQRSDPKSGNQNDYPQFKGPQGDVLWVYNYVRCVRYADVNAIEKADNSILNKTNRNIIIKTNAHNKLSISLTVKQSGNVSVNVYALNGKHITTLENSFKSAGTYRYQWFTDNQSNGVYLCKVSIGNQTETRTVSLIRN